MLSLQTLVCVLYTSKCGLAPFPVLSSHMWLLVRVWDSSDLHLLSYLSNLLGNSDDLYGVVEGSGNLELTPLSGIFPLSI